MFLLPPAVFFMAGFLYEAFIGWTPNIFAKNFDPAITISVQLLQIAFILLFVFLQVFNKNITLKHIHYFIFGILLKAVILTFILSTLTQVGGDTTAGYWIIGIITLALTFIWKQKFKKSNLKKALAI